MAYNRERFEVHPNGNGFVQYETEIHRDCVLKNPAMIWAGTEIHGPAFITGKTNLRGDNQILEYPMIHNSTIEGRNVISGDSIITNSQILGECVITGRSVVDGCVFTDQVRVRDRAILTNVRASGFTIIGGNAIVRDCELESGVIIHSGFWDRSPRIVRLGWITVIEGHRDYRGRPKVSLDCQMRLAESWLRTGPKIGADKGMTVEEVSAIRDSILFCIGEAEYPAWTKVDQRIAV